MWREMSGNVGGDESQCGGKKRGNVAGDGRQCGGGKERQCGRNGRQCGGKQELIWREMGGNVVGDGRQCGGRWEGEEQEMRGWKGGRKECRKAKNLILAYI